MDNPTSILDDEAEELSVLGEVRSILISGIGIVLSTAIFLHDEIELANRRRVLLTAFLITLIANLIAYFGFVLGWLSLKVPLHLVVDAILQVLLIDFVRGFVITLALIYIASSWSHRWLRSQGGEKKFIVYMQALAILTIPQVFVTSILSQINQNVLFVNYLENISTSRSNVLFMILVGILNVCVIVYYYWLIARILYFLYPELTRGTRRGALVRIIVANVLIGILVNIQTVVNIIASLLPPGTIDLIMP